MKTAGRPWLSRQDRLTSVQIHVNPTEMLLVQERIETVGFQKLFHGDIHAWGVVCKRADADTEVWGEALEAPFLCADGRKAYQWSPTEMIPWMSYLINPDVRHTIKVSLERCWTTLTIWWRLWILPTHPPPGKRPPPTELHTASWGSWVPQSSGHKAKHWGTTLPYGCLARAIG